MSLKLKPQMNEQEVFNTLGQPKRSEFRTCGQQIGQPWQCKRLFYGIRSNGLVIFLEANPSTGAWVVNSWNAQ
jgi:hypothetical protein